MSHLDQLLKSIDVENNLLPFLKHQGWEQVELQNPHWIVMHGETDIYDQPLELIFPREKRTKEREVYTHKAVELLATLKNEPAQLVAQRIIEYGREFRNSGGSRRQRR